MEAKSVSNETPLAKGVKLKPRIVAELESLGFVTMGDLRAVEWTELCRRWLGTYRDGPSLNAVILIIAALEGISWTRAKLEYRASVQRHVRRLRRELGILDPDSSKERE